MESNNDLSFFMSVFLKQVNEMKRCNYIHHAKKNKEKTPGEEEIPVSVKEYTNMKKRLH